MFRIQLGLFRHLGSAFCAFAALTLACSEPEQAAPAAVDTGGSSGSAGDGNLFASNDIGPGQDGAGGGAADRAADGDAAAPVSDAAGGAAEPDGEDVGEVAATVDAGASDDGLGVADPGPGHDAGGLSADAAADADTAKTDAMTADGATADGAKTDGTNSDALTTDAAGSDAAANDSGPPAPDAAADGTAPDSGPQVEKVVRFAALGDTGTGSPTQYKVGKALGDKCKQSGCDLVLYLGDNFYDTGVKDENDEQFKLKFEDPYATVEAPFWVVLGNHDYGSGGAGAEFLKKDHYIKYGKKNPKFHLPEAWWHQQKAHVHFFALDSNSLLYGDVLAFIIDQQVADMNKAISASTADWKIAFAHHPMRSNGPHGNVGCYEGAKAAPIPQLCGIIPVASGNGVKAAYEKLVCGRLDALITGHDHGRQWLNKASSTKHCKDVELLISGGGAKTTEVETKSKGGYEFNPFHWQDADKAGFLWVEIKGDTFYGEFIDEDGKVQFSRSFQRTP